MQMLQPWMKKPSCGAISWEDPSTAFIVSSETDILTAENTSWSIRPYARKEALGEKDFARKWSVKPVTSRLDIARCTRNHSVPAILFSAGGYSGNFFHAFTDIIIPLYSTARTFNREVQFLITDRKPWWIAKFKTLFEALSRYEIIDIDDRHDVHCFQSLTIGLKGRNNKELSIDSSTSPYSMKEFRKFLRSWYSLKKITAAKIRDGDKRKPRLLIIPRKRSRSFTNVDEIAQLAESLSYQVIVAEPGPDVSGFAKIINSCDVVMGVHGAGLTNIKMQYPADHEVLRDPSAIGKQGWVAFRSIYLDKQNVTLDVERFRPTCLFMKHTHTHLLPRRLFSIFLDADAAAMDEKTELRCNIMGRSEFCEMKGDIRIDGNSSTAFIVSSETDILTAENTSWSIRPYARKEALGEKDFARKWSVKPVTSRLDIARCTRNHSVPAILFSAGGYSGNFFHAFTDIIIPLYSTARTFNREVQFLITDRKPWWIAKFKTLFEALSRYEIIDIDDRHDVHCFQSLTIGLKGRNNKELSIDSSTSPYSMKDFRKFLRSWYSLKKITAAKIRDGDKRKPRLLIIPRKRSRSFHNVGEIAQLAESLSYQVIVAEPGPDVSGFAKIINSCDVLMGVHGAALTNIVFLPENAILIQVVPFGKVEWASRVSFEDPAKDMNIRYLDYKIKVEESTLIQQYPADHEVLRDPSAIGKQGWVAFRSIYLDKQNVTLDVERFRPTLYQTLLDRSFSKHEQKKLGYWALLACLLVHRIEFLHQL
uniref:Glycosyltransferase 61 catalytic domain-containing protein n=1 Tax=Salix viminalis TaxID=40686 RepID=A0A6N2KS07_SALVM